MAAKHGNEFNHRNLRFHNMILLLFLFISSQIRNIHAEPDRLEIKELHLVISNHLDCGYTTLLVDVVNKYFDEYFPQIRKLGDALDALHINISWIYTTQPWLISLYLECPPYAGLHCPSDDDKTLLLDSIVNRKELTWHAFPFNSQLELYDASMLEYGVWLSTKYLPSIINTSNTSNLEFQIPTVLSQRDVPSMTRSVIPILQKQGLRALSVGVNEWSAPPDTPDIFRWLDPVSNTELITMIHAGNYGGFFPKDVVMIANYSEAIMFAWNGDNAGPFSLEEIVGGLEMIRAEFPNAYVHASTFDNYVDNLLQHPDIVAALPVIDKEIGDTWQYGVPSDPLKLSRLRIAQRHRARYLQSHSLENSSYAFNNFSRFLLKNGEHTFGINVGAMGAEAFRNNTWTNEQMKAAMMNDSVNAGIHEAVFSWNEQRRWGIQYAMDALRESSGADELQLYKDIMREFETVAQPKSPLEIVDLVKWVPISNGSQEFSVTIRNATYSIQFNATTGALSKLLNTKTGINYVQKMADNFVTGLGVFYYSTRTESDFQSYWNEYAYRFARIGTGPVPCEHDFCKNGLHKAAPFVTHQNVISSLIALYKHETKDWFIVEMDLGTQQSDLHTNYGAPYRVYSVLNFSSVWNEENTSKDSDAFSMQFTMVNKTWTRIPENLWVVFNPNIDCDTVLVNKIGELVDIQNVAINGSWHLHSVDSDRGNVQCKFQNHTLQVESIDAALSGFVPRSLNEYTTFPIPLNVSSDLQKGVAFALFDNTWNTNYPFWYPFDQETDANLTFRFNVLMS